MKIEPDIKLDFSDVLIRPKRTVINSRSVVDLTREFKFKNGLAWKGIPIMASNMDTIGTFDVLDVLSRNDMLTCLTKFYSKDNFIENANKYNPNVYNSIISTGIGDKDLNKLCEILEWKDKLHVKNNLTWVCVDIANGYISKIIDFCNKVKNKFPNIILIAGNVVTREMTEELIINGNVDIVKVGIGPGSACLTRLKTGVGMPQLSAIAECADAAHGVGGFIIADGGITCPGDMAKAFGAGADFVMVGGQFAGHDENPGEVIEENNKKYKLFYGMSSEHAMNKHYGKMDTYRSSEGKVVKVPYKGKLQTTILDYLGGIRSTCTYINAKRIKDMSKCCTFVRVNNQLNNIF
jgi:GMP reductase